jgi:tRNA-splicing endonuclease subunit Sen34
MHLSGEWTVRSRLCMTCTADTNYIDVVRLRDMYRITGTLVESLPRQPMQNILHGLPLILLPEEVTLLLSLNAVRLVDERRAYRDATEAERAGACHVVTQQAARIHLPTATPDEAVWHEERCGDTAFDSWEAAREAGVWVFPENALECRRFRVYRDLWERGWWLSSGLKFGGDYLAYEGKSLWCSASGSIVCLLTMIQRIRGSAIRHW